ncbi:DUF4145 domain-containing protein [Proteus mirabilis]
MKDWAHIVRIDSNGAIHSDEEFTKEEAKQILGFTEVFLMYSFTLPAMIEKGDLSLDRLNSNKCGDRTFCFRISSVNVVPFITQPSN